MPSLCKRWASAIHYVLPQKSTLTGVSCKPGAIHFLGMDRKPIGYSHPVPGAARTPFLLAIRSKKEVDKLCHAVANTEVFVRDQPGDARSFSLDSPKSREPKIARMRKMAK